MDTHMIGMHYRRRPPHLAGMQMGKWFATALDIQHEELLHSHGVDHTKDILLRDGLNNVDPAILILFNQLSKEK